MPSSFHYGKPWLPAILRPGEPTLRAFSEVEVAGYFGIFPGEAFRDVNEVLAPFQARYTLCIT